MKSMPLCLNRPFLSIHTQTCPCWKRTAASVLLALVMASCSADKHMAELPAAKASGSTVVMPIQSPQRAALTVQRVEAEPESSLPLTGRLVWDDDVTVRVFTPFAGIVRDLPVDVNMPVSKGTILAEIGSGDFSQAQADARKAGSDCLRTERNLKRFRDLFEHGAAPRKDAEAAEADYADAQAEKDRAEARLAFYGASCISTNQGFRLPSPLAGLLVERNVTPGQEVRADQMLANTPQFTSPLFVVTDPTKLWIWLDVTETHLPLIRPGQELRIRSKAFPNQVFKGHLDMVGNSLDPVTRTVRARGTVENPERLLKAELYVTVDMPEPTPAGVQVPARAVFLRNNQYYVFLETAEGRYERQPVQLGSEREGRIAVLGGLKGGERLVTEGCLLLQSLLEASSNS